MKDGGPAFCGAYDMVLISENEFGKHPPQKIEARSKGMSLRDYFAAAALQGMIASNAHVKIMDACLIEAPDTKRGDHVHDVNSRLVLSCYMIADAMLAERDK